MTGNGEAAVERLESAVWPLAGGVACAFVLAAVLKGAAWQVAFGAVAGLAGLSGRRFAARRAREAAAAPSRSGHEPGDASGRRPRTRPAPVPPRRGDRWPARSGAAPGPAETTGEVEHA